MEYTRIAASAVRLVERIPSMVWAGWIAAVVIGTAVLALRVQGIG